MKGKLHETIAVESELANVDKKLREESIKTFSKESLFLGQLRELNMFDAASEHLNTTDRQELTSTVGENLDYLVPHIARHWDVVAQKDATNQAAIAEVVIDDRVILKGVSAMTLLGLETKLKELRKVFEAIPTLAPGVSWVVDDKERPGIYKTEYDEHSFKTEKDIQFKEASPATKEHPAQVAQLPTTTNVGKYDVTKWSGMYSPARKAQVLDQLDVLRNAIKRARMRANNTEIVDVKLGKILLDYILAA